eukprot:scaffold23162_cov72-Skeletonema_dohrnii-CCMP3373.AAC.1
MADDGDDDVVFVYLGGEQVVPDDVRRVVIDRSVNIIPARAFAGREQLVSVETHAGIEKIEEDAFSNCISLRKINLIGVREIEWEAFCDCRSLTNIEFGDELDRIGESAFHGCRSLRKIKLSSVRTIEPEAFTCCGQLADVEFGCNLERIQEYVFHGCPNLRRIAIPLKDGIFPLNDILELCTQFDYCDNLTTVDLVGVLPNTPSNETEKTDTIRLWIGSLLGKMERYKAEHYRLLKHATTLLELAIWKAKLVEEDMAHSLETNPAKRAKLNDDSIRKEQRVTSGASIVIKNVLPFLKLE